MPFLAEEHIDIPTTDLLSWMFDKQPYDTDKPVKVLPDFVTLVADQSRSTSTLLNPQGRYLRIKPVV
jgi:hypothetical protein